jgi:hypothetical protein
VIPVKLGIAFTDRTCGLRFLQVCEGNLFDRSRSSTVKLLRIVPNTMSHETPSILATGKPSLKIGVEQETIGLKPSRSNNNLHSMSRRLPRNSSSGSLSEANSSILAPAADSPRDGPLEVGACEPGTRSSFAPSLDTIKNSDVNRARRVPRKSQSYSKPQRNVSTRAAAVSMAVTGTNFEASYVQPTDTFTVTSFLHRLWTNHAYSKQFLLRFHHPACI